MTTKFRMVRDITGANSYILTNSDTKMQAILAANTAQSVTVPTDYLLYRAVFSFNGAPVWVAINDTAAIPTGTFASTTSELSPVALEVGAGDTISFITSQTTAEIGVKFYAIEQ